MGIIGKESWGGISVGEGERVGLALVGWDSLEVSSPDVFRGGLLTCCVGSGCCDEGTESCGGMG
jgi:hypothetical protein